MVLTRSKCNLDKPHNNTADSPLKPNIFKNLISALESPVDIKTQLLKSSYYLLIELSSRKQICTSKGAEFNGLVIETNDGEISASLRDVYTLSRVLFQNLRKRLKHLHSTKHHVSATRSLELEELNLLIRCCMVTLTICVDQQHLLESGRFLLLVFKKLTLLDVAEKADFERTFSCQCMHSGEIASDYFAEVASLSSLELFDTCIPSITALLEVIIDELLVHGQLRKYLQKIDSYSPNTCLFKVNADSGNFGLMMEMICSHFSLSISGEVALKQFLNTFAWAHSNSSTSSALGIIPAKTLLQNPIMPSSPKLLQAHIVSLVADVISVGINHETRTTDPMLIDCYLSIFESSVILYTQHMSDLKTESCTADARGSLVNKSSQPLFESCIDSGKSEKLSQMITALNNLWNSNLRREFFERESELISSSMDYVRQNVCIIDTTCRDEILSFLKCMILRAADDVNDIKLPHDGDTSLQDICLLASLLMLMSNSLIQALKGISNLKVYDIIAGSITCFKEFNIRFPIQKFSHSLMERNPTSRTESRLMLLHFLGLLSLCFDSGLGFLVKSCVSVIMGLCNLLVSEEGSVDSLRLLVEAEPGSLLIERSLTVYKEAFVCRYPSLGVAAKFQKTRTLFVSNACAANEVSLPRETCSGEVYLKTRNVTNDVDDLADFIECQKDKDYVGWLKDRGKFRERKLAKRLKRIREKKKQAWRSVMGKT
ncbi:hypothetical protein HanPI659440_Chr07g0258791 [Helianthus annuus]|nr:hypothetical protein HanPI659440_Chr07g0258791 [Helianthus annuus]